jgi:hypothetical protein
MVNEANTPYIPFFFEIPFQAARRKAALLILWKSFFFPLNLWVIKNISILLSQPSLAVLYGIHILGFNILLHNILLSFHFYICRLSAIGAKVCSPDAFSENGVSWSFRFCKIHIK